MEPFYFFAVTASDWYPFTKFFYMDVCCLFSTNADMLTVKFPLALNE